MIISIAFALAQLPPNPESRGAYQNLQPYILLILGGCGGYFLGLHRDRGSRIRLAKDRFLKTLADQRAMFDSLKWREADFFEQSVHAFTHAVYEIRYFIPANDWTRLHTILQEYQAHHKNDFEGGRTRVEAAIRADLGTGKTHAQTLEVYLNRFDDWIHKRR